MGSRKEAELVWEMKTRASWSGRSASKASLRQGPASTTLTSSSAPLRITLRTSLARAASIGILRSLHVRYPAVPRRMDEACLPSSRIELQMCFVCPPVWARQKEAMTLPQRNQQGDKTSTSNALCAKQHAGMSVSIGSQRSLVRTLLHKPDVSHAIPIRPPTRNISLHYPFTCVPLG